MTQYNALMTLQQPKEHGETISEDDVRKTLNTNNTQALDPLINSAKEQGTLPDRLEDRFRLFLKTRSWILHDCVYDSHLSFKSQKSKEHFFGMIEAYNMEAKALKAEIFKEMESWLKANGYDLDRVYPLSGGLPENID